MRRSGTRRRAHRARRVAHRTPRCRAALAVREPRARTGARRRRPRTIRSTTPSANGTTQRTSVRPDAPPARRAVGEEEAVRCSERSPHARVERADERLGRSPELAETTRLRRGVYGAIARRGRQRDSGELPPRESGPARRARTGRRGRRAGLERTAASAARRPPRPPELLRCGRVLARERRARRRRSRAEVVPSPRSSSTTTAIADRA